MKEVYGNEEYNKLNKIEWTTAAEKSNYVHCPAQGANECGFYVLRIACTFDGEKFVQKIKNCDVRVILILLSLSKFFASLTSHIFCMFCLMLC